MSKFFVPFVGENPAAVDIKGHRLVLVSTTVEELQSALPELGGDRVCEIELAGDNSQALADLAAKVNGGVVLTPPGISVGHMLVDLERELPWVH